MGSRHLSAKLTIACPSLRKAFKSRASKYLRQEFANLRKLPSVWSRSYCFCTAGNARAEVIQNYINGPHHG
ncbi:transposase [Synechococcus sp. RC10B2]|uniref:transposase n=1 Tax=Synechococcus sp. RC10B2 TaxID=2964530 RepID=UPI0039C72B0D